MHPVQNSDFSRYLRAWSRVLKFGSLVLLISMLPLLFYIRELRSVGEFVFGERLAEMSRGEPILWMSGYYNSGVIKPEVAKRLRTKILFLGNSRVLQFRPQMFDKLPPRSFYTMGGALYGMIHAKINLEKLLASGNKPELIFLGLESKWFQRGSQKRSRLEAFLSVSFGLDRWVKKQELFYRLHSALTFYLDQIQLLQRAWRDGKFHQALREGELSERETGRKLIGISARISKEGFRNDGSLRYDRARRKELTAEETRQTAWKRLRDGGEAGNFIDPEALGLLRTFLIFCKEKEIPMIGFLLPIQKPVLDIFRSSSEAGGFWSAYPDAVSRVCLEAGAPFHDLTDPATILGVSSYEFANWNHGSESISARMLLKMIEENADSRSLILKYLNPVKLKYVIDHAKSPYSLFGD